MPSFSSGKSANDYQRTIVRLVRVLIGVVGGLMLMHATALFWLMGRQVDVSDRLASIAIDIHKSSTDQALFNDSQSKFNEELRALRTAVK